MKTKRLGDMLVSLNLIDENQLQQALDYQKSHKGVRMGQALIQMGFITEKQLIDALRMQLGIDYVDLSKMDIDPAMAQLVPKSMATTYSIVPLRTVRDSLYLAMADPLNFIAIEQAKNASGKRIIPMIANQDAVDHAIARLYGNEGANRAMAQMREEAGFTEEAVETTDDDTSDAPTIRLVNAIIERAYDEKASDIHFEPTEGDMIVRMRIDGKLHNVLKIPKDLKDAVISRLKVMGRLDIVERRIPQDGRAEVRLKEDKIDLRLSTMPTIFGEKAVIRLLARDAELLDRKGIGIFGDNSKRLDKLLGVRNGVIMIVGPTGSGKSSTMYSLIGELLDESVNLITLEDPVEYHISGATQVQINDKVGLTFAAGLRAILRQDPDIICVGEIRDGETAQIAMRAALTGHLVITTIHTEDAVSAIDRLRDMDVEPYLIAGAVRGIISQRLVRRICENCKTEYTPDPEAVQALKIPNDPRLHFYHGAGCDTCFHTGYRGRIGIFEVLLMNEELRHAIAQGADKATLEDIVAKMDFTPMLHNADELIVRGITTVEEVNEVIGINL